LQELIRVSEQQRLRVEIRNNDLIDEIQRREAVEHALRDSEERWQLVVSGTNDGVWDWNPVTGESYFSPRWKSMLGYAEADLDGNAEEWRSRIHPDDLAQTLAEIQRHLRGESQFYECEHRLRCKNGSYKWILARGRALFNESGRATRVSGSHTDMTERHQSEALLQDRTEQLNVIFELSPDGFISFDAAHRVKYASPAFIRMVGIHPGQISGLDEQEFSNFLAQLCSDGGRFRGVAALRESAASGEQKEREIIQLSLGGRCYLEVGLRASESISVSQILYFRDVTYETEVDQMKSEFLSTAAHELRTPMASIYGFAELLLAQDFDEDTRNELLSIIHKQSKLMASILNELLDLARIEERRGKDFVFKATDVQALVNEVVSQFKLPEGRSLPTLLIPADTLYIMADRKKAQQAILNVLSNAYKYSPEGGEVSITIERNDVSALSDGVSRPLPDMVIIRILDHGMGMTAEQLERVYERFYRADSSGSILGTGLGMSITKEIINLHHGVIEMTSQIGQGTVVTLKFPVAHSADSMFL
ncbi:MAG: PAS domain-containing protein, partial [Betaproteobacteria bacterium]